MEYVIAILMLFFSMQAILSGQRAYSILGRASLSSLAVLLYSILGTPDVAITEALLGALLTTLIYLIALKARNTVKVGFSPVRLLFERHGKHFMGFEYELLNRFFEKYDFEAKYLAFASMEEVLKALRDGKVDVACGGVFEEGKDGYLETRIFQLDGEKIDLLRYLERVYKGERVEALGEYEGSYRFLFQDKEMESLFKDFLREEREFFESLKKKYFGEEGET